MANARILKLREYEDRLASMKTVVKEEARAAHIATWQEKSDDKLRQQAVQRRFEELKVRKDADLHARRQRLAEKLFQEDAAFKSELLNSRETPEQRRAKLADRARQLAAKREAKRAELAATLQEQAFINNCDILRETNSKRILFRTLDERTAQIEQKMAQRIVEEEEARMFADMNEAERQKLEQRHEEDKRRDRERKDATVKILDEQVRALQQVRATASADRQQEIAELQALWARLAAEQDAADAADRDNMRKLAAELKEFNRLRQSELSDRDLRERELDLKILQEALAREAADEAREAAARQKCAEDMQRYRHQLQLMGAHEQQEDAARDALIQAAADAQQAKEDAERAARDAARARLMAEVDAVRQLQIRDKQGRMYAALEEQANDRQRLLDDASAMAQEEALRRAAHNKRMLEQKLVLQTQMVAKAHIKASEEDEKVHAMELAQQAEQQYMTAVKDVLQKTEPAKWHGRRKFDWYS